MSTKTSIKRIALVAASALGFGLLSVAPSNAAAAAATPFGVTAATSFSPADSFSAAVSVVQIVGDNNYVEFTAGFDTDSTDTALPVVKVTGGTVVSNTAPTGGTATLNSAATQIVYNTDDLEAATDASFRVGAPTAGTITVVIANRSFTGGVATDTTLQTFTITVGAAPVVSATYSTEFINAGSAAATSASDLVPVLAPAALSAGASVQAANILVTLNDTNNLPINAKGVSATIAGPGLLGINADAAQRTQGATGRAVSVASTGADNTAVVTVWNDGTAGVATVTLTSGTVTLGTKQVTFYGTVSKLTATQNLKVARATSDPALTKLGCDAVACAGVTAAATPAIVLAASDANGNPVPLALASITATSSNTLVLAGATFSMDDATLGSGPGFYNVAVSSAPLAASGSSATITFSTKVGTTTISSDPVTFTLGGSAYNEKITLDKSSYSPGEAMVVTRTATDSSGNPVFDGAAAGAVKFSKLVGGTEPVQTEYRNGTRATSATTPSVFAPSFEGSFLATFTGRTAGVSGTLSTSASVTGSASTAAAEAAADAAAEAIDAANAATDAANLAAEAADAATVAAEEARDAADAATAAVEELATQVATLMAALKAQITTLANTVAKIAKKVKA